MPLSIPEFEMFEFQERKVFFSSDQVSDERKNVESIIKELLANRETTTEIVAVSEMNYNNRFVKQ